tara:strand:+ start:740 stop:2140 length:1401 start_codon:yes stop_codon:yes gene_type:complete
MINKFYKIIHNKYSRFFKFIFFLRYLFVIFFISIIIFLCIPYFFNYEKRVLFIKDHLLENYNVKIKEFEKLEFQALPLPKLKFKNVKIFFESNDIKYGVKNIIIYPKLISIYNYQDFKSNKIVFKKNDIILDNSDLKFLIKFYFNQKNKIFIDNLNLEITDKVKSIISFKNIKLSNYGYNKNLITGELFGKKFKLKKKSNFEKINFKLKNSGFSTEISFDEKKEDNFISGSFKSKVLNTNIKSNFNIDNKKINIFDSYFRNKNISFNNKSLIIFDPFLEINSIINIEDLNFEIFKKLNLEKLLGKKDIIKEINLKKEIIYKSNKLSNDLIEDMNLKIDLAYGRANYVKKFSISDNLFNCVGNINLLDEFPLLFFDCSVKLNNNKFFRNFSIRSNNKFKPLNLNISGNLNIYNKKVNLKNVFTDKNYNASKEDLRYFKEIFEKKVFDEGFFEIFNYKKIKNFILEVS